MFSLQKSPIFSVIYTELEPKISQNFGERYIYRTLYIPVDPCRGGGGSDSLQSKWKVGFVFISPKMYNFEFFDDFHHKWLELQKSQTPGGGGGFNFKPCLKSREFSDAVYFALIR